MSRRPTKAPARVIPPQIKAFADKVRAIADGIEAGTITGMALAATSADPAGPVDTSICDPGPTQRIRIIGAVAQLLHLLNTSETTGRMASLARQLDPANHGA